MFPHHQTIIHLFPNAKEPDEVGNTGRKVMDDCLKALAHFEKYPTKDGVFTDPAVEATYNALWDAWHCAWDITDLPKRKGKIDHPTPTSVN
jgi:hypothetical protein